MLKGETALKQLFDGVKNDSIEECRAALADIDVNTRKNGRTALHHAAMRCQVPMIEFLIEQGKYELLSKSGYKLSLSPNVEVLHITYSCMLKYETFWFRT